MSHAGLTLGRPASIPRGHRLGRLLAGLIGYGHDHALWQDCQLTRTRMKTAPIKPSMAASNSILKTLTAGTEIGIFDDEEEQLEPVTAIKRGLLRLVAAPAML